MAVDEKWNKRVRAQLRPGALVVAKTTVPIFNALNRVYSPEQTIIVNDQHVGYFWPDKTSWVNELVSLLRVAEIETSVAENVSCVDAGLNELGFTLPTARLKELAYYEILLDHTRLDYNRSTTGRFAYSRCACGDALKLFGHKQHLSQVLAGTFKED